jgi:hypothetical protein
MIRDGAVALREARSLSSGDVALRPYSFGRRLPHMAGENVGKQRYHSHRHRRTVERRAAGRQGYPVGESGRGSQKSVANGRSAPAFHTICSRPYPPGGSVAAIVSGSPSIWELLHERHCCQGQWHSPVSSPLGVAYGRRRDSQSGREDDGRRIFSTERAFRRASSTCAHPFRFASLSQMALWRWKETPLNGAARPLGKIVLVDDTVAADATCAWMMGFEPDRIVHIREHSKFVGNASPALVDQLGETVAFPVTPFQVVPGHAGCNLLRTDHSIK